MSIKNIFKIPNLNIDNILKFWFTISTVIILCILSWSINYVNEKISIYGNFLKITIYLHYILIFFFIFVFLKSKNKLFFLFLFSYLFGDFLYNLNYSNINGKIIYQLKNNTFILTSINKSKELLTSNKEIKIIKNNSFELNPSFDGKIIVRKDDFPNTYIVSNNFKDKIIPVFENVKNNQKILPVYLKKIDDSNDSEFVYYDLNTISKVILNKNYKILKKVWSFENNVYFHHWGDIFDGKIFLPGTLTKSFPDDVQKLYKTSNLRKCKDQSFYYDTIEVLDDKTGEYLYRINLLEKLYVVKEIFNKDFKIACKDPLHLNDVIVLKSENQAKHFSNGKVGDLLISLATINAIVLLDKETFEVKWYFLEDMRVQHSPRVSDNGVMYVFDNQGGSPVHGTTRIISIDINAKKVIGVYEAKEDNFFENVRGGRLQLINEDLYVNAMTDSELFKIECDDIKYLKNCKKVRILKFLDNISDTYLLDVL